MLGKVYIILRKYLLKYLYEGSGQKLVAFKRLRHSMKEISLKK